MPRFIGKQKVLDSIGISVEEATVLFLKEVVARNGLPFSVSENELQKLRNNRTERIYDLCTFGYPRKCKKL